MQGEEYGFSIFTVAGNLRLLASSAQLFVGKKMTNLVLPVDREFLHERVTIEQTPNKLICANQRYA